MKASKKSHVLAVLFSVLCVADVIAAPYQLCDLSRPSSEWHQCVGRLDYSSGDRYLGQFERGQFHGFGRFSSVEGVVFNGFFERGLRSGPGVSFDRYGNVLQSGYWQGATFKKEKVDLSFFIKWVDELPFSEAQNQSSGGALLSAESPLQIAIKRIAALETELAEERKQNERLQEEVRRRPVASSNVVTRCLRQGLKPGTAEFSRCIEK